jgi:alpha-beta hydrolase superfamily lysophospholipase
MTAESTPAHVEGSFRTGDGLDLYYQRWLPAGDPRSAVVLVHGFNEHCGRYARAVRTLTERGHVVYGFDQRGFGRSPGRRTHIERWAQYREDLGAFLQLVRREQGIRPLFLYGHSLGGVIVLDYALADPAGIRGIVCASSALAPAAAVKPYLAPIARLLSRVWPTLALDPGLDRDALSREPAVVQAYVADPLVQHRATMRFGAESLKGADSVNARAAQLSVPILILHGEADGLSPPSCSRRLFESIRGEDKSLRLYPGAYHELHNDLDFATVLSDVCAWIDKRGGG